MATKRNVLRAREPLGIAPSHAALDKIRSGVFSQYDGLDVYGITADARDTAFTYEIHTDARLTKARRAEIAVFIRGVVWGMR